MNRIEAIEIISRLYPADSTYGNCAEIGQILLEQAQKEMNEQPHWRNLSEKVLTRYAQLCILRDRENTMAVEQQLKEKYNE